MAHAITQRHSSTGRTLAIAGAAVIGAFLGWEAITFWVGNCQGFSGTGAYEMSVFGGQLGLWSVDPLTCN